MDGLIVSHNIITFEKEIRGYSDYGQASAGIRLWQPGNLRNVLVKGNVIKDAPAGGIRVGAVLPSGTQHPTVNRIRIVDNIIVDAGNNSALDPPPPTPSYYRHAIGLFDEIHDADVSRNLISDTRSDSGSATWGKYSLYLNQTVMPASTNVRTSQNAVRVAAASPGALRAFQVANAGLVDASGANDVLISTATGATLSADFMSYTQYLTTINNSNGSLTVQAPTSDAAGTQWTVGQQVTFRFLCAVGQGCSVNFASPYSTGGPLVIGSGQGRAISFQAENWPAAGVNRYFFELYRGPAVSSQ